MAGFMGQKGTLIVCGDAGEAFADSMYETTCFVGGRVAELGNDAVIEEPTATDQAFLGKTLSRYLPHPIPIQNFKKVVSGRKLWNFDKKERTVWREAL
jgi:glutamate synthase domain-containing protein 3